MRRIVCVLAGAFVVLCGVGGQAMADLRSYVWTYEYLTLEPKEAELEYYLTIAAPDSSNMKTNVSTEHKIEYEVGMTKHFDFGIYQVFEQESGQALEYKGFQLRGRYRFGEKGDHFMDSLLYLEYEGVPDFTEHVIEVKWVLAKDFGPINISLNPILEIEKGDETEVEAEYAAGVSYKVSDLLRLGLEAKGSEYGSYVGPVVSHGKGRFWANLGSAFAVSDVEEGQPEFQLRLLMGIGL